MEELELDLDIPVDPSPIDIRIPALRLRQPLGDLYLGAVKHDVLARMTFFDVRRVIEQERDFEKYLGIQRPLVPGRVRELEKFVRFVDASFPTSIVVALEPQYADYDDESGELTIRNRQEGEDHPSIAIRRVGKVIDGQHRIAGLLSLDKSAIFDVPVVFLLETALADQAYMFAMVNLEQTKVNKSLAIDLFALAKSNSPERIAHKVAVALDSDREGPFYKRIKRLGVATPGRDAETLSQANFVGMLLPYITENKRIDRDMVLRGQHPKKVTGTAARKMIFRNFWIDDDHIKITAVLDSYFYSVRSKWPSAWNSLEPGNVLPRTNGFRALMRALRPIFNDMKAVDRIPTVQEFGDYLQRVKLKDNDFNTEKFPPGSSGESKLFKELMIQMNLEKDPE
jgi:DGQHR domain-containing protein